MLKEICVIKLPSREDRRRDMDSQQETKGTFGDPCHPNFFEHEITLQADGRTEHVSLWDPPNNMALEMVDVMLEISGPSSL